MNPKYRKKPGAMESHADVRVEQRYGFKLTWANKLEIAKDLQAGKGSLVKVDVGVYDVPFNGVMMRVVFDHRVSRLITFLQPPPPVKPKDLEVRMIAEAGRTARGNIRAVPEVKKEKTWKEWIRGFFPGA